MEPLRGEHPNVVLVRDNLAKLSAGDIAGALRDWAPEGRYHAFDAEGIESTDLREVTDVMAAGQRLFEHHENHIVAVSAVGDELVSLHMRAHAVTKAGATMTADYLIVLSVREGTIRWACDFIDSAIQSFLDEAWS